MDPVVIVALAVLVIFLLVSAASLVLVLIFHFSRTTRTSRSKPRFGTDFDYASGTQFSIGKEGSEGMELQQMCALIPDFKQILGTDQSGVMMSENGELMQHCFAVLSICSSVCGRISQHMAKMGNRMSPEKQADLCASLRWLPERVRDVERLVPLPDPCTEQSPQRCLMSALVEARLVAFVLALRGVVVACGADVARGVRDDFAGMEVRLHLLRKVATIETSLHRRV